MQAGGRGEGRSSAATKAVAAGLLGLQLLGMPIAVVGRQARSAGGATLPGLEVVVSEAGAKAPLSTQEELIGELKSLPSATTIGAVRNRLYSTFRL